MLATLLRRVLGLRALAYACIGLRADAGPEVSADGFLRACLRWLGLTLDVPDGDLERIPASGPLVVVCNHPTGAMEGVLLLALLRSVRHDVRVLANQDLQEDVPEIAELVLPVDVFAAAGGNVLSMRRAVRWVRGGGCVLAFPSGEVASRRRPWSNIREARWHPAIAGLQRCTRAAVLPVWIGARNPVWYRAAGSLNAQLRTLLLPRLLLAQRSKRVQLRVGRHVPAPQLDRFAADAERIEYLQLRSQILQRRVAAPARRAAPRVAGKVTAVALPVPQEHLEADIAALPPSCELLRSGHMRVLCARARRLPHVLAEIGRLRELTFRGVGEGSGLAADLDRFDAGYEHLFVWDERERAVVGAYRLGVVDQLLEKHGADGLYTSSLYRYGEPFLQRVRNGLELGRSFVQPAYQREYLPLWLLWRGIGAFVARSPQHHLLFGTVSISADHHATSVRLMVDHLRAHCFDAALGAHVEPLRPWRQPRSERRGPRWQRQQIADLRDVSAMVRELEVGRQGVPVLLEQYLKLGAKVVGINVDPEFHTIDALVVVDMLASPRALQVRYLGQDGSRQLRDWHGAQPIG